MGVDYNHRVLVGIDVSAKRKLINEDEETFLPYIEGHYNIEFDLVDDYESQDFLYFGKVLADGDKYVGIEKKEIDIDSLSKIREEVAVAYKELFKEECDASKIKLIACTIVW